MREILIDLTCDDASSQYRFAGYEGEHNATLLTVVLPKRLMGKEGAEYRFLFETAASEAIFSAPIPLEGDRLSVKLTKQLTCAPILKAFVGCYVLQEGEVVLAAKSSEMLLGIQKSVSEETGDWNVEGGSVPGLVIEKEVIDSKNPVSSAAILAALNQKIDRFELGSVLPDSPKASSQKPVSEKAVADALKESLAKKIDREELSSALPSQEKASEKKPASEKAVADALALFLKKEEYIVEEALSAEGKNPVAGGAISAAVACAVKRSTSGEAVVISDVSPLPQTIKVHAKTKAVWEKGDLVTESRFAQHSIEADSPLLLEVLEVKADTVTFQDGLYWEGSGQLLEEKSGSLSEVFSKGDLACVTKTENGYGLYKAQVSKASTPVKNAAVRKYGKNLCAVENWICHDINGITDSITLQSPPHGTYTFSAYVTKYPEDTSTNTRIKVVVYYKDGSFDLRMGTFDENSAESDGITRLKTITFTTNPDKDISHFLIAALDYSVRGVRNKKAEKVQLEYAPQRSEFVPYLEPSIVSANENGEACFEVSGEDIMLFSDRNIILSTEYNCDIGKRISGLEKAIIALGGTV